MNRLIREVFFFLPPRSPVPRESAMQTKFAFFFKGMESRLTSSTTHVLFTSIRIPLVLVALSRFVAVLSAERALRVMAVVRSKGVVGIRTRSPIPLRLLRLLISHTGEVPDERERRRGREKERCVEVEVRFGEKDKE